MEYKYWLLLLSFATVILIFLVRWKRKKKNLTSRDETHKIKEVEFKTDGELKSGDDFVRYLKTRLAEEKIPKNHNAAFHFLSINFEELRLGYVFQARRALVVNDVEKTYNTAIKEYVSDKT